ncbi:Helix-turn-helix [Filimonas lacunae]|uniref:Helix-turn-helix n=1 Tax=Filimonas lacunae TaxID=477680 RepID=A0A1N7R8G6_9BACT|nr:helix-turn-helix transcriptional regulator [Filimonas lacunae]SIT31392.1 Helix-turn-helix [Filimonas lacunae]
MLESQYLKDQQLLLGRQITFLRIKAGFNNKETVGKIYTGSDKRSSIISRFEKGNNLKLVSIIRLANIFKVPVYCFFDFQRKFRVIINDRYVDDLEVRLKSTLLMVAKNMKRLRKERNWSQLDLEIETGIDRATLGLYETGSENLEFDTLVIISQGFKVEVLQLLRAD